jgi:lipopolysaccharide biosynthesis glycosyltransferase
MHHVALCFSDSSGGYYKHALVTAASVFANAAGNLCLHVVHDDTLSGKARTHFSALPVKPGHSLVFHNASDVPPEIEAHMPRDFNRGALFRLMLPEMLPDIDSVLYLDCDIVCECDAAEVFEHDISPVCMGAVRFGKKKVPYFVRRMGLDEKRYINSGVLLLNLKKLRQDLPDLIPRLFAVIRDHHAKCTDQEALNIFFNRRDDAFLFLPERFNLRIWQKNHAVLPLPAYKGNILHFSGKKPWEQFTHAGIYYWKHYAALFPGEPVFERMTRLPSYEHAELCEYMLKNRLARDFVRRLYEMRQLGVFRALFKRMTQVSGASRPGAERR